MRSDGVVDGSGTVHCKTLYVYSGIKPTTKGAEQMIEPNIQWTDYCEVKRMNPSTLVAGVKSMKRLRRAIDGGFPEETNAMRLGSGIHALLLEPEEFEERFCVIPSFNLDPENLRAPKRKDEPVIDRMTDSKATTYYKNKVEAFKAANEGKCYIDRTQYDTALTCIEALHTRGHFIDLVSRSNKEVTVYGEIEGVDCKGRLDMLATDVICDLKTTHDVSDFGRTTIKFGYLFKLAFYRELIRQNTVGVRDVKVIAQETSGDFDNAMFPIPSDLLDLAYNEVIRVMLLYKQSLASGIWHGWDQGEDEVEFELPYFARKQMENVDWSNVELQPETESYF